MIVLYIVLIAIAIGGVVFLMRKYVPGLKSEEENVDEARQVEEEVNRMIVNPQVEKQEEKDKDEEE